MVANWVIGTVISMQFQKLVIFLIRNALHSTLSHREYHQVINQVPMYLFASLKFPFCLLYLSIYTQSLGEERTAITNERNGNH